MQFFIFLCSEGLVESGDQTVAFTWGSTKSLPKSTVDLVAFLLHIKGCTFSHCLYVWWFSGSDLVKTAGLSFQELLCVCWY